MDSGSIHYTSGERRVTWLYAVGVLLLVYAVLGNYVALPGYLCFLEAGRRRGARSIPPS